MKSKVLLAPSVAIAVYSAYLIYNGWGNSQVDLTWPFLSIFFHGIVMPVIIYDTSEIAVIATIFGILYWMMATGVAFYCLGHNMPFNEAPLGYLTGIWAIGGLLLFLLSLKK